MPSHCVIAGCANPSGKSVTLHAFPKDPDICKQWVDFVWKTSQKPVNAKKSYICSKHFQEDDIANRVKVNLGFTRRLKLKDGVVPSKEYVNRTSQIKPKKKQLVYSTVYYQHQAVSYHQDPPPERIPESCTYYTFRPNHLCTSEMSTDDNINHFKQSVAGEMKVLVIEPRAEYNETIYEPSWSKVEPSISDAEALITSATDVSTEHVSPTDCIKMEDIKEEPRG